MNSARPRIVSDDDQQRDRDRDQQRRLEALAVGGVQAVEQPDADQRAGHAADRQPLRHAEVDRALAQVPPAAERLRDRAVGEVGADRDDRRDAGEQHEQRRHERAAADAGQADEDADAEAEGDDHRVHQTCSPHSVLSVPAQRPSRPLPGFVHGAQPIDS